MVILHIAFKDLLRSFSSISAIGMMVIAPLGLIGLIYIAFVSGSSGIAEQPALTLGLVNDDSLPAGALRRRSLGEDIRSLFFAESIASRITVRDFPGEASARAAVESQETGAALIIPRGFTRSVLDGKTDSQVLIITDPTSTSATQVAQEMITAMLDSVVGERIANQTVIERRQAKGLQLDPAQVPGVIDRYATWYARFQRELIYSPDRAALALSAPASNETAANAVQLALPMMMAGQMVFFAFFTGAFSMMSILREQEEGTLARLFTAPVRRETILAGKFLAVFSTVAVQGLVIIVAAHYVFGVSWGAPLAVALALAGHVIAAAGLGVFMIAFVKNSRQGGPVLGGGLTALGMLGGLFTANISLPKTVAMLAYFTPQGWVIKSWGIVLRGQPISDLMPPFVVMVGMGLVTFMLGAMKFDKRYG